MWASPPTDLTWVTERIAVGGEIQRVSDLTDQGITHVINCQESRDDRQLPGVGVLDILWLPQPDDGSPRRPEQVIQGVSWAIKMHALPRAKLYVHCAAGVNRSPLMVYAILRHMGWQRDHALATICNKRTCAQFFNHARYITSVEEALASW